MYLINKFQLNKYVNFKILCIILYTMYREGLPAVGLDRLAVYLYSEELYYNHAFCPCSKCSVGI